MVATTSLEILDTTNIVQLAASKPTVAMAPRRSTCVRNKANKINTDTRNSAPDQRAKCHHHRLSSARFGFAQLIDCLSLKTMLQRRPPARAAHPDARLIGMNFLKFIGSRYGICRHFSRGKRHAIANGLAAAIPLAPLALLPRLEPVTDKIPGSLKYNVNKHSDNDVYDSVGKDR